MNTVLWILQIVLALMFLMAGVQKTFFPKEKLDKQFPWAQDFGVRTVRVIGVSELAAAIGLVLPAATGILPVLTPLAAVGLVVVMALAMNVHRRRGESSAIVFNAVLLVLAAVVVWGRFGPYSF